MRLTADGRTRRIFTKAQDVKGFLAEQRVFVGPEDLVIPPPETLLHAKTAVTITRVTFQTEISISTGTQVVTWQTRTRQNLRRVLVQKGYAAVTTSTWRITLHDGAKVDRKIVSEKTRRKPFYHLLLFNGDGFPATTYNLLQAKTYKVMATGYYVGDPMVPGDETFLGHKLQRGLIAVDPKVIPLGWRLYIPGYGYSYSSDTGSAIKGMRIDVAVKDAKEEARYNHRHMTVYLLEKARRW